MTTLRDALHHAAQRLAAVTPTPRLDAEVLLRHVTALSATQLLAHDERELTDTQEAQFAQLIKRRGRGEPVAYLTGCREFWSLPIQVGPDVLIPRPDTELLVEHALLRMPADTPCTVADLGAGSGAIVCALASERPQCTVTGIERSGGAAAMARENTRALGLHNAVIVEGDWSQALQGEFDLIVSNPPYVAADDPHLTEGDVRFEPRAALAAGVDGLDAIRVLLPLVKQHLKANGWLLIEHGYHQGAAVRALFAQQGYDHVETLRDLGGNERVTLGQPERTAPSASR